MRIIIGVPVIEFAGHQEGVVFQILDHQDLQLSFIRNFGGWLRSGAARREAGWRAPGARRGVVRPAAPRADAGRGLRRGDLEAIREPRFVMTSSNADAIGRPMPAPALPQITKNQGIQADAQHIKTPLHRPNLVGSYHFHTVIQVVTPEGVVVGQTSVEKNNNYKVQITTPQSVGVHRFQLRALDSVGHISRYTKPFLIKVVPKKNQS